MIKPDIVMELEPLFRPQSVAVIGATNNRAKWGYSTFFSLQNNYPGKLYPVNRQDNTILGCQAFPKVTDIPGPVDLVVVVVPPENVAKVMEDCVAKGVKAGVIISAGFAEIGEKGKAMQDEVIKIAKQGDIRLVGPNCMGMWSAAGNLPAFMFPMRIMPGPLALISQGGNIGGALVADAVARGIGFQQYVSCGCTADIQIEDYVEYLGYDDSVKVIMLYIEGLGESNRFVEKVKAVTAKKPVIAMKPGRTEAAIRAISSHSGTLSGSNLVYDSVFRKTGVIRTYTTTEMLDVAIGFLTQPLPKGKNVIITTPGGSYGVMCAEACALQGLNVIDLPEDAMETFNSMFPERWSHGNPVDPAGDRDFAQYLKAPEVLLDCPEVDAIIFMGFGSFSGLSSVFASGIDSNRAKQFEKLIKDFEGFARNAISVIDSGDLPGIRELIKSGLSYGYGLMASSTTSDLEGFFDMLAEALTSDKMMKSNFIRNLRNFFESMAQGSFNDAVGQQIIELIEPIIGALIDHWIQKYNKPVITTTFTETLSRISEEGHFPYPNAKRASNVLAKLVEYSEYLERINTDDNDIV
ncbi:MAG: CoA-binding protein [Deltaproteobacteria bacterium]|nr:CoA-binding protein [Deltaproteobacteria bacterium]